MLEFLRNLIGTDFMPHGHCDFWRPEILWLHVLSHAGIALAYYSIPISLLYFVRKRRDIAFGSMAIMFGAFICACGTTHVLEIWTVWTPMYRLAGVLKAITSLVSMVTAVALWRLIPMALSLPSAAQLRLVNTSSKNRSPSASAPRKRSGKRTTNSSTAWPSGPPS